ncbi:MAG: SMC family ATPase [Ruminococcus sp.]|nr:SMC family ATPase [Ruminococcus sp.]
MKPLKLTIQAFGSYGKKTEINFTKPEQNLFLITGDTGAGKSTIFDAIVFALYGEASSDTNKKDGNELQSQYADYNTESFVELVFTEKTGDVTNKYTVRREPQQLKIGKRSGNLKSESAKVSLIMPDGIELRQDEAKKKIREIVILDKKQFMQVSMIAQGEFAKFLRSKSSDKKKIFRKIFDTEIYDRIVSEIYRSFKEKDKEIKDYEKTCRDDSRHIIIPADCPYMADLQKNFAMGTVSVDKFVDSLCDFCGDMDKRKESSEKDYGKCVEELERQKDAFKSAQSLTAVFSELSELEDSLPDLKKQSEIISAEEKQSRIDADKSAEIFAHTETVVNSCLGELKKLDKIKTDLESKKKVSVEYEALIEKICKMISESETKISGYEKIIEENAGSEKMFFDWQKKRSVCEDVTETYRKYHTQKKSVTKSQLDYEKANQDYERKFSIYQLQYKAFLDLQAGIIARDELRSGMPCPVCGSTEHPVPCVIPEEYTHLDSQTIENLKNEVANLDVIRKNKSEQAGKEKVLLDEYEKMFSEKWVKLREIVPDIPEVTAENIVDTIAELRKNIASEGEILQDNVKKYDTARKSLDSEKSRKEKNISALNSNKTQLAVVLADIKNLEKLQNDIINEKLPYPDELSARTALDSARRIRDDKKTVHDYTLRKLQDIQNKLTVTDTLIKKYREEVKGKSCPDMSALQNALKLSGKNEIQSRKNLDEYNNICSTDRKIFNLLSEQADKIRIRIAEYEKYANLYKRLSPSKDDNDNTGLEAWVQRFYLNRILDDANSYFSKMTSGQFELCLDEGKGGGEHGLDIYVYSTDTGKKREVRTLSGGETFIASLSLALGMSEQIQKTTAVVNTDVMFIDEGFGSLDEHSRNQAVTVLKEMADGNRLIGIISHVTEMKQDIDIQLSVTKDNTGSHVQWITN